MCVVNECQSALWYRHKLNIFFYDLNVIKFGINECNGNACLRRDDHCTGGARSSGKKFIEKRKRKNEWDNEH